jgi:tetratricopeptide (TPR) repeat protein
VALKTLRIFISSPGDVAEERLIARRVIGRLDMQVGDSVHLEPVFWEHEPLVATATFQEQILRPSQTDIVLVILFSRLGTALAKHVTRADGTAYASGTEFEFEDALEGFRSRGKPDILVYRKQSRIEWSADAGRAGQQLQQQQALEGFFARWFADPSETALKAAFHSFGTPADFEDLLEAHLWRLVQPHLPAAATVSGAASWRSGSPFRGLETFEPEHAAVFFGRTAAVASVLLKLRRQGEAHQAFVLIVAMSGGGKSSLVRAGVLPLLLQPGVVGEAKTWRRALFRPSEGQGDLGLALIRSLLDSRALPELGPAENVSARAPDELAAQVGTALEQVSAREGGECHLALVVDQLEEIFSDPRIDARAREAFVAALDALARSGRVWILATMRSDVYPRLVELPVLMKLKEGEGQFDLLPPTLREIGQIIRLPAAAAGLRFEVRSHTAERLDDTIRDAAAKNPGALPLLQFLLEELYQRRSPDDVLTFRAYEELGAVEGALARRAEAVLSGVSEPAQLALPDVFRELVTLSVEDESRVLRRSAPRSAFTTPAANELIGALIEARLLVSALDAQGEATISLAHEALLEFWPRLREWREKNRENLHIHARLSAAANTWEKQGRSADLVLARGRPLAEARALAADGVRLSPAEAALLHASERRARRFVRLRASAVVGLSVLAILASIAAWRATVESNRARIQATTAQRTSDFLVSLFNIADPEENRGETVTVREILDRGVEEIRSGLSGEQVVRANLLRSMGQAYNGLGLYARAHPLLEQAVDAATKSGAPPADVIKAQLALAANRYLDSDYETSERLYRSALSGAERLYGNKHPVVSDALTGLGDAVFELQRSQEAESLYRRALASDLELHGELHESTARSLNALGWLCYFESRYAEAEPLFRRALSIRRQLFGERHVKVGESLNNLGSLLFQSGDYAAASAFWTEALPVYRQVFSEKHREVATTLNNLGRVELLRNQIDSAQKYLEEALAMDRALLAPKHDDLVLPLNSLAMVHLARGDAGKARPLLNEALEIARERDHWMLGQVLANEAQLAVMSDDLPAARQALNESRTLLESQYGTSLTDAEAWRAAVLDSIEATCDLRAGQSEMAEKRLREALPTLQKRFGDGGLYTQQAAGRLAQVYKERNMAQSGARR